MDICPKAPTLQMGGRIHYSVVARTLERHLQCLSQAKTSRGKPSREAAVVEVRLLGAAESLSSSKMAHEAVIVEVEFDDAWALLASLAMLKLPIPPPTAANGSRKTMGRE
jgi:hypothetical protein